MKNSVKLRKGEEQALSLVPRVMRPLAVVAACLIMSLVVLPTAGVAVAAKYNNDNGGGGRNVAKIALISAGVFALVYLVTDGFNGGNDKNNDNGNDQ